MARLWLAAEMEREKRGKCLNRTTRFNQKLLNLSDVQRTYEVEMITHEVFCICPGNKSVDLFVPVC